MRVKNVSWGLCATVLMASAAHADERFGVFDDSPRFMLYVQKQLGTPRHKSTGPSFGFAVDRASSARILDLRVAPFDHNAIMLNGLRLNGEPQGLGYAGPSWDGPLPWIALAFGAALGVSCATENWPCESSDDDDNHTTDTSRIPG